MTATASRTRMMMDRLQVSELALMWPNDQEVGTLLRLCDRADNLIDHRQDATAVLDEMERSIARLERMAGADTREALRRIRRHWSC